MACSWPCLVLAHTLPHILLFCTPGWLHSFYITCLAPVDIWVLSLWFPCSPSPCPLWRQALSTSELFFFWEVWLPPPWAFQGFSCFAASAAAVTKKTSATSSPDEIWSKMTLFASKRRTKGFVGRRGANQWAGCANMAGPGDTSGQMLVAPGCLQGHMTLSLSFQDFISFHRFLFLISYLIFPILPLSSRVIFSLLSAPSGGPNRNWWWCRDWIRPLSGCCLAGVVF